MSKVDDLRRLTDESRSRVAAVAALREQQEQIALHSRRCLEASRRLLERGVAREREEV